MIYLLSNKSQNKKHTLGIIQKPWIFSSVPKSLDKSLTALELSFFICERDKNNFTPIIFEGSIWEGRCI